MHLTGAPCGADTLLLVREHAGMMWEAHGPGQTPEWRIPWQLHIAIDNEHTLLSTRQMYWLVHLFRIGLLTAVALMQVF